MKKSIVLLILFMLAAVFLLPVLLTLVGSLMSPGEVTARFAPGGGSFGKPRGLTLIPTMVTLKQYYTLLIENAAYLNMFWKSVFYASVITVCANIFVIPLAFVFAKLPFRGSNVIFFIFLLTMMMPFQVTLLPVYIVLSRTGLLDTAWSLTLPSIFAPFGVFLLRQFIRGVPNEYTEAALLETNSVIKILRYVIIPTAKNGVIAMSILIFAEAWNLVEQPILFLSDPRKYPLSAAMNGIMTSNLNVAYSGSILFLTPIVVLYLCFEEQIIEGLESYKW